MITGASGASSSGAIANALVDGDAREAIRSALDDTFAVEAAAGTGKTSVLVDRIVNILAQGLTTVDHIVAVTFTEKAAGELKLRLRACLETERARATSQAMHRHLDAALANLEQAHVSTIHGFCADLLRERPVEARLDPQFTTLTEGQAERLYSDVFRDWLQRQLEDPPEGIRRALRRSSFDAEHGPVKRLERAGWTLVEWRDFSTPWRRDAFDRDGAVDALATALEAYVGLIQDPGDKRDSIFEDSRDARRLMQELSLAERVRRRDYDGLEARFVDLLTWRFRNIRTGRKATPYRNGLLRSVVLSAHQQLVEQLDLFRRAADADLAALLQNELRETVDRYQAAKARLGALDFLDLLVCARDLVRENDRVRAAFQERFTHLFVDEFQDTDPLQAELLLLLSADDPAQRAWRDVAPRRGKLFVVGDPKQSIYRFRRADVGIYQEVRDQLARHGARCVELTTSFRARPAIQRVVNAGFEPRMQGDPLALQASYVPLSPARVDAPEQPAVVVLPVPRPYDNRNFVTKDAINASLPDAVGAFIDWLIMKSGWTVTERENPHQTIPLQARHICLLFRRFEAWGEDVTRPYVQALESRGVPHVLVGGKSFHEREEVETMRTALTAIEWPDDEIAVFGALHGALFSMSDEALFEYRRLARRVQPFMRPPEPLPGHLRPVVEALDILRDLHLRRNYRPVPETIARLLDVSRAHVAFALRPSGEQALANVHHIAELARQYESDGGISFRGFVEQFHDEMISARSAEAPILEEGSDGVRIMTAHKAKGLEFPVVVIADITAELSRRTASRWADSASGRCAVSLAGWVPADLRDHEAEEIARDEAEGVRVAYVAATRARDLLVVPAVGDRPHEGWASPLNAAIYPGIERCREPGIAPGCPAFGKDSVLDREATIPFTSVCPGQHSFGADAEAAGTEADAAGTEADAGGADAEAAGRSWGAPMTTGPAAMPVPGSAASYAIVWWDPALLDLDRQPNYGLRREELIVKDAPSRVVQQGLERYHAWRVGREGAIERGSTPSLRVLTVRARAAAGLGEKGAGAAAGPGEREWGRGEKERPEGAKASDNAGAEARDDASDDACYDAPVSVVRLDVDHARVSGPRFGALVHAVLGLVPLDASPTDVRRLVEQQVRVLGATAFERDAAVPVVTAALRHDLFARARQAQRDGRLRRETPLAFVDDYGAMVEGVVDLAFEEEHGWTVVDFKTDQDIEADQLQTYLRQVALYAAAIGRATGRPATGILLRL